MAKDAATTWAEESDQRGDYDIINRGDHGPVLVREEDATEYDGEIIEVREVRRKK